ncbi:DUF664 domain-containing protein [Actinomycetota bacterium]
MTLFEPQLSDERTTWTGELTEQVASLRRTAGDLTDEQARERPTRSELSVGGIIKHVTFGLNTWIARVEAAPELSEWDRDQESRIAEWHASFALAEGETLAATLADYDAAAARLLELVGSVDLDTRCRQPAQPWFDPPEMEMSARWGVGHVLVELVRHAGHADIIREQLDGKTSDDLAGLDWEPDQS